MECESVGVSYLAPADIYRQSEDKVPRYFATPLTEHYPVIHAAKYELGMRGEGDDSQLPPVFKRPNFCSDFTSCEQLGALRLSYVLVDDHVVGRALSTLCLSISGDGHVHPCVSSISATMGDAS